MKKIEMFHLRIAFFISHFHQLLFNFCCCCCCVHNNDDDDENCSCDVFLELRFIYEQQLTHDSIDFIC